MTPKTDMPTGNFAESPSHPYFQQHQSTGESDSGIDMNFQGFQSDWSQSSPSSSTVPAGYMSLPASMISPMVNDAPPQFWTDPKIQAFFAAQVDHATQNTWPAAPIRHHHEHTNFLPPPDSEGYQEPDRTLLNFGPTDATIKTDLSGLRGNGKHRAVFRCS